jgi:calreticulin
MKLALLSSLIAGTSAKVFFEETFGSMDGWVASEWKSDTEMGKFELKTSKFPADEEENLGLATTEDSRFYGIAKPFEEFSNKDTEKLIVQYQVKYDSDLECGGGYVKIGPTQDDLKQFGDPTPYNIMFGPDKCGYNSRTHLIFNYKGKNILKKTDLPYKQVVGETALYRMMLAKDNTVKVEVNGEEIYSGSLADDWEMLEPKEIPDESDTKPEDWPEPMITDPEAKKPEDYVEAEEIPDPDATKPEDWDAEEDGEWEAPKIPNPHGFPWEAPKISNPDYKPWVQKQIPNPKYVEDDALYAYDSFGFAGFDLWQVKSGAIFDNLIITDDEAEAEKFVTKWKTQVEHEKAEKQKDDEKKAEEASKKAAESSDEGSTPDVDTDDDAADDDEDL